MSCNASGGLLGVYMKELREPYGSNLGLVIAEYAPPLTFELSPGPFDLYMLQTGT